ncbi:MAG: CpsB/CapC family capsule biosynthesis tyrosine phosphatase [Cyclobacteriaceae bacterium]
MFGFGKKSVSTPVVDIHSHLIPAMDDGVKTLDDSIMVIKKLADLGFKKVITTPHIHPSYPNSADKIRSGLNTVQDRVAEEDLEFAIEVAAEYFVDDVFMKSIEEDKEILSFGPNFVLVESSFLNKPMYFESCLFELQSKGYQPVLAHPERYQFLEGEIDWLLELKAMGIFFQVTISSFVGFYGKGPEKIAKTLFAKNMIDFLGSDLHTYGHIKYLEQGLGHKSVEKLCKSSNLKNGLLI